ncbi:MAG TPA: ATP-binding cassette domain-containing protein, partial [Armatimonadota bacterium]|nr:ATP-binding cassette domain-containing protein [Armatimonadota bacterium]
MALAIQTEGLTKEYVSASAARVTVALKDLTLDVEEGEIFGFLGPNGAGKTTTIKILLGLIFPTAGHQRINRAVPCHRLPECGLSDSPGFRIAHYVLFVNAR